jgi:internalin A
MPLHQADIHLTRARLFRDRAALAEARRLIEKHGYHRRDGELADAEAAAQSWPEAPAIEILSHAEPMPSEESTRNQVFISYSRHDKKLMGELLTHLKPYLRGGIVTAWSDQQISPGSQWFDEIQSALAKTSVAVLLVSPDFLASDFIHEHELTRLLKEAEAGGVKILWVQLRACAYEETPLKHYQAVVSPPDKPLAEMKGNRDQAWVRLCKEIKNATPLVNP